MENKRDAASAGLAWPVTSNRGTPSTVVPEATTGDTSSTNPPSTPSASLEPMMATIGTAAGAPLETYSASPHPAAPFPTYDPPHIGAHRHSHYTERVVHQIHFKIFTHSNNERQLFIEEIPSSGISKCRDPEHFFYGLSGNWEWSTQTADYWRHHFEIPLLHGHNPFRHVAIDTALPPEATSSLTTISFNSSGPTFRLIDGNQGIGWVCRYIANGREHELPWCDPSSSRGLIVNFLIYWVKPCHVTVSKVYSNSCIKLQLISFVKNRTLLRQVCVCVWHICIDVKLLILFLIMLGFAKLDVWCCTYYSWAQLDSSKRKPCLGRVCVCDTSE